jgi:flagellar basal body-associated protein FliL
MMMVVIAILVIGGGAGAFLVGKSMSGSAKKETAEKGGVDKEIVEDATKKEGGEEKKEGEGKKKEGEGEKKEGEKKEGEGEKKEGEGEGKSSASAANDLMYQFDKFTVNLMDPKGPRWFLMVSLQVKASSAEARAQIEENVAPLRDATITLLTSKTRDDASATEGKERIKRELMARYEGILSPGALQGIYFNDFVVMTR